MDQSTYLQRLRYKVTSFGQQGSDASNRYLDRNGSYHTETVAGRALDNTGGYCCSPPTVPEPPFDISGIPVRDPTARLTFTAGSDGRSPITNYLVSIDGINFTPCSPPVTESPIFVTDLSYGTTYTFCLKAVNDVGVSAPSNGAIVYIPNLPAAPTGLSGTPDVNSVSVAFTAGNSGGSPLLNYWYSLNSGPLTALAPADAASPVTIPGLSAGTSYTINLAAENVVGTGPLSAPITVTTTPAVTPPTLLLAVADVSSAYVYFTAGTGDIINYQWSTDGITFTPLNPFITTSPVHIPDLTNDVPVTIYLRSDIFGGATSGASNSLTVTPTATPSSIGPALLYDVTAYSGGPIIHNSGTAGTMDGTIGSGVTYNSGVVGGILDFHGALNSINPQNGIVFPQYNFGSAFTVCTWIYPRARIPGNNTINGILTNVGANNYPSGFKMGWNTWSSNQTTDNRVVFMEAGNGSSGGANFTVANGITYSTWQHIAYVFDQANARIIFFVNGIAVAMQTSISPVPNVGTNNASFVIGTFVGGSYPMNAQLSTLKVFGYLLNATDIYNDYNTTKSRFGL